MTAPRTLAADADPWAQRPKPSSIVPLVPAAMPLASVAERPCQLFVDDFAHLVDGPLPTQALALPRLGSARTLQSMAQAWALHVAQRRPSVIMIHHLALEAGLTPFVIRWMQEGWVQAVMLTGQAAVMDVELALAGKTKPVPSPHQHPGPARETAHAFAIASRMGQARQMGLAQGLALHLQEVNAAYKSSSVLLQAIKHECLVSVHPSMGQEDIFLSDHLSGSALGESSQCDFRRLAGWLKQVSGPSTPGLSLIAGPADPLVGIFQNACRLAAQHGPAPCFNTQLALGSDSAPAPSAFSSNPFETEASPTLSLPGPCELVLPLLHRAMANQINPSTLATGLAGDDQDLSNTNDSPWRNAS